MTEGKKIVLVHPMEYFLFVFVFWAIMICFINVDKQLN